MLTDSADIVTITPELTTPQFLFDTWHARKDFARSQALDNLHDLGWTVAGHRLDEKMHMITIRPDFEKGEFITLGDFQADRFQDLIDFFTEDDSSVFGRAHDMVQQDRCVMSFSYKVAHACYLIGRCHLQQFIRRGKPRGMYPDRESNGQIAMKLLRPPT